VWLLTQKGLQVLAHSSWVHYELFVARASIIITDRLYSGHSLLLQIIMQRNSRTMQSTNIKSRPDWTMIQVNKYLPSTASHGCIHTSKWEFHYALSKQSSVCSWTSPCLRVQVEIPVSTQNSKPRDSLLEWNNQMGHHDRRDRGRRVRWGKCHNLIKIHMS
jgi:hypothetical protein